MQMGDGCVAKLLAKSAGYGLLPLQIGELTLVELPVDTITSVAPYAGKEASVSKALKAKIGAGLPAQGRAVGKASARVVWSGLDQVLVLGPKVNVPDAAVSDQSDGWLHVALEGDDARDVLARLCPLDLRDSVFKRGHAAGSLLGHMNCLYLRTGADRYEMLVFRSMAHTAVSELKRAMESVTAQAS